MVARSERTALERRLASSLGHFLYGSPDELTTRGLISVFVDVAAGLLVMAVAL